MRLYCNNSQLPAASRFLNARYEYNQLFNKVAKLQLVLTSKKLVRMFPVFLSSDKTIYFSIALDVMIITSERAYLVL